MCGIAFVIEKKRNKVLSDQKVPSPIKIKTHHHLHPKVYCTSRLGRRITLIAVIFRPDFRQPLFQKYFFFGQIFDTGSPKMLLKLCTKFQKKITLKSHRFPSLKRKSIFSESLSNGLSEKVQIWSSGDPPLNQIQEKFTCLLVSKTAKKRHYKVQGHLMETPNLEFFLYRLRHLCTRSE